MTSTDTQTVLSRQSGCTVFKLGPDDEGYHVLKRGHRVKNSEREAMTLVSTHAEELPVPKVLDADFDDSEDGMLWMTFAEGDRLDTIWKTLDPDTKRRLCSDIWACIATVRTIPRPKDGSGTSNVNSSNVSNTNSTGGALQCLADGSAATYDPLLRDEEFEPILNSSGMDVGVNISRRECPRPIRSDAELRQRIYERYRAHGGDRYADTLLDMLPRCPSRASYVFTHGDVAPRNILVRHVDGDDGEKSGRVEISALLDWENAGWYPYYWEYANIMGPAGISGDWQRYMDETAPAEVKCDLKGILAARAVLF